MRHLYTHIKCGGENVPSVDASEIPNRRDIKIILYVWFGRYRNRVEFGKY